ncbi:uncharacterized protein LOC131253107 isoform X2 [Magnolia sinica]|uniref:uncharacterized protein LOC131253107 isoform X2 n=1 Tax=Magnolia sinica TaxID=86752 RepID=UPI002657AD95|nr:uncharacterized protein LOC131253107 isoform X2 [Magnolia sinica]
MLFFDLNIPFLPEESNESSKTARKNARLKVVVKSMELGYTGIAYNRSIKGVMSDSDRCTIPLLPLSSLLKLAPTLSTTVRFHRELLGVPLDSPFRQYTRLTVAVDSAAHAAALNSGNPVLKTYDLVAVRPLNQVAFDQVCKVSEVDLIAIDFSQKLPFRLKLPMVKAAIERGVYFEITYSPLISDIHARRQMLPGAKLLVDWTRGKNLIFSSAAPTANELRGPCDVANLSSLLGLSMERAKAAISKNCRSLIASALRKKQCYKEVIRIERISDDELLDSEGAWFGDWNNWDPISSGEGDLSLDDIATFFSAASNRSKSSDATDKSVAGMPLNTTPLKDQNNRLSSSVGNFLSLDTSSLFFSAKGIGSSVAADKISKHSNGFDVVSNADWIPLNGTPLTGGNSELEANMPSPNDTATFVPEVKELEMTAACNEHPNISDGLEGVPVAVGMLLEDTPSGDCVFGGKGNLKLLDDSAPLFTAAKDIELFAAHNEGPTLSNDHDVDLGAAGTPLDGMLSKDCISSVEVNMLSPDESMTFVAAAKEVQMVTEEQEPKDVVSVAYDVIMEEVLVAAKERKPKYVASATSKIPSQDGFAKTESQEYRDDRILFANFTPLEEASAKMDEAKKRDIVLPADDVTLGEALSEMVVREQDVLVEHKKEVSLHKAKPGKGRFKLRPPRLLPFKSMLKPQLFKKRMRRLKR